MFLVESREQLAGWLNVKQLTEVLDTTGEGIYVVTSCPLETPLTKVSNQL